MAVRPDLAVAHNGLAQVFFKTGAVEDAIRELETAVRLDPAYADARHNLETLRSLQRTR